MRTQGYVSILAMHEQRTEIWEAPVRAVVQPCYTEALFIENVMRKTVYLDTWVMLAGRRTHVCES